MLFRSSADFFQMSIFKNSLRKFGLRSGLTFFLSCIFGMKILLQTRFDKIYEFQCFYAQEMC